MKTSLGFVLILLATGCPSGKPAANAPAPNPEITPADYTVKLSSEVIFDQLNPARGDQSPKAGTVWGTEMAPPRLAFCSTPSTASAPRPTSTTSPIAAW